MSYMDPNEAYEDFKEKLLEEAKGFFPITGKQRVLELAKFEVRETGHPDAVTDQHEAKLNGRLWGEDVYGHFVLKDKDSGKVLDTGSVRMMRIPRMTKRYSYIVSGQEYQVDNQWQRRRGVYVRRDRKGQVLAEFSVRNGKNFKLNMNPESQLYTIKWNTANLPAYPVMQALGVTDEQMASAWGIKALEANRRARGTKGVVEKIYKAETGQAPGSGAEAQEYLKKLMNNSWLDEGVTKLTLGAPHSAVTGSALLAASKKMADVHAGKAKEDDTDALPFKRIRTTGDFAVDKMRSMAAGIRSKMYKKVDWATGIRDVVRYTHFAPVLTKTFTENAAVRLASQVNPLEMISASSKTTVMGPGGMTNTQQVTDETKMINPTHFGFLDPLNTPEGDMSGVSVRLPFGVRQIGGVPHTPLFDLKTGKTRMVSVDEAIRSTVALPDQVTWKNNQPKAKSSTIKLLGKNNDVVEGKLSDAQFILKHPGQVFGLTTNMIPFLHSVQGNRSGMAARHLEQAVSLAGREPPLVQVGTGFQGSKLDTFEKLVTQHSGHSSAVDGTVKKVDSKQVVIQDHAGKTHTVQLYDHYPLTDTKSFLSSSPLVKPGDKIQRGQLIAEHNYSKDGQLALGKNLKVAFLPFKGLNFEDGIVISQAASNKLTSQHMYKEFHEIPVGAVTSPLKFADTHPGTFTKKQLDNLPDDGVVRVGHKVMPGDPLIVASTPFEAKAGAGLGAIRKTLTGVHTDHSLRWGGDFPGTVVAVHRKDNQIRVHVRSDEPVKIGDKIAGRFGNKGVVTAILPDHEMPYNKAGEAIDIALNPSGIPGRLNPGQVYETVAAKIAKKTGKPYVVQNFGEGDQLARIKSEAKKHGVSDAEELFDPITKMSLGQVTAGPMYMLKLIHQVEKQGAARSGMTLPGEHPEGYDINLQPRGGGHAGGQRYGTLGMYALLAHGATANLREGQTVKSEGMEPPGWKPDSKFGWRSGHRDAWEAMQLGTPLPPPQPTFAFKKFEAYLRGAGVDMQKKGHTFVVSPLTDKQILGTSSGEVKHLDRATTYNEDENGNPQAVSGGIFDPKVTGGHGGKKWSHVRLAEPVPNPMFEKPIRSLLGMSKGDFNDLVGGKKAIGPGGNLTELGPHGMTGGAAVRHLLGRIDVTKSLAETEKALVSAPISKLNPLVAKAKYLRALKQLDMQPDEAYVLNYLPVIPPVMRPTTFGGGKSGKELNEADLNQLYRVLGEVNTQLANPVTQTQQTNTLKQPLRQNLYDGVKSLMGLGSLTVKPGEKKKLQGIMQQVAGPVPKEGMFQKMLLSKRQDLSMRAAIIPEPSLGLDEVGLPEHYAAKLFRPFVVDKMVQLGYARSAYEAQQKMADKDPLARKALEAAMENHPVLLKRDPALHKYSVQGFQPVLTSGKAIKIHPLVVTGFNADFDGDRMAAFLPIGEDAKTEARKMMPSNNLFSDASGKLMYLPTLEASLGLYKLGRIGSDSGVKAKTHAEALHMAKSGKIGINDRIDVGGTMTTPGRILVASALPKTLQQDVLTGSSPLNTKGVASVLSRVAQHHQGEYGTIANRLKDLGNGASYGMVPIFRPELRTEADLRGMSYIPIGAHTLRLDDFEPDRVVRTKVLGAAQMQVNKIWKMKDLTEEQREARVLSTWMNADQAMADLHAKRTAGAPDNLTVMKDAGVKPGHTQYKQLKLAPMVVNDSANRPLLTPIKRTYSEGLDLGEYWIGAYGARRGLVRKVQEVQEPGVMTKALQNVSMDQVIVDNDCHTSNHTSMSISDPSIHGRFVHKNMDVGGGVKLTNGTMLTPDIIDRVRKVKKDAQLPVRSPLRCAHTAGICQKCYGLSPSGKLPEIGANVGVIAAHAVGERSAQITLKEFHTGGVAGVAANPFEKFERLVGLHKKLPNEATLARVGGTVEKIERTSTGDNILINGKNHFVGHDAMGKSLLTGSSQGWEPPKMGSTIRLGQMLSDPARSTANPRHVYEITQSLPTFQNHMVTELDKLFASEGIHKKHHEVLVRAMTSSVRVNDPGDSQNGILRGEVAGLGHVQNLNTQLLAQGKKPIRFTPNLQGISELPLTMREDWMAKMMHKHIRSTVAEAASQGAVSNVHGSHPVPGLVYGAEFGLNVRQSKKPGMQHLSNVPGHAY